jgi:hypothetical protein
MAGLFFFNEINAVKKSALFLCAFIYLAALASRGI